ncbi:MAG TPA: ATP-grasp domain-containing protein [Candidatus Rifleibacterium sp.]|nr:ATP-grasp domain-containing protein [Candidatus Rifleibacterium sp.]
MKILLTALGTLSASAIIQRLKSLGHYVIGTDINAGEYLYASRFADEFIQFPSVVGNPDYFNYVKSFCIQRAVDLIIPIIDEEVELLTENACALKTVNIDVLSPGLKAVRICRNKYATSEFTKLYFPEIHIPTRYLKDYSGEFDFPVFVKPSSGRASIDCSKVLGQNDLNYFRQKTEVLSDLVIQPLCSGSYISVDLIRDAVRNDAKCAIRKEILRNANGAAIAVQFVEDESLMKICCSIAEKLDADGVLNFEFFQTESGFKLIEINPRFPAGTEFTCLAGLDLIADWLRIKDNKPLSPDSVCIGKKFARRYESYEC